MPGDSFGVKQVALIRNLLRRPRFIKTRLERQQTDLNILRFQLAQVWKYLRLNQRFS
jgi:hypothetical protein